MPASAHEPRRPSRVARRGSRGLTPESAAGHPQVGVCGVARGAGVRRCVTRARGVARLLDRGRRFRALAQHEFLDLSGRGFRQLAED